MKRGITSVFMALAVAHGAACQDAPLDTAQTRASVVYETDDRQDVYAFPDTTWADRAVEISVALIDANAITTGPGGAVTIAGDTLAAAYGVCPGERFADQITPAFCSGTLVTPDMVLTSGQCVPDQAACDSTRLVFDFHMVDAGTVQTIDAADDVYSCVSVIASHRDASLDYAFIQLDRPVFGRLPALVRPDAMALDVDLPLHVVGYPSGLPLKIDDGARVRDGRGPALDYFVTEADTFAGSAGSGVFDQTTGELVGVMARGETDFVLDGSCTRPNQCDAGTCAGEDATYAFRTIEGLCGDGTCLIAVGESSITCPEDCGGPVCGDGACNGGETPAGCALDCGTCGDGTCDPAANEDNISCAADCAVFCGDGTCDDMYGEDSATCVADCSETCGDGDCAADESPESCCQDCGCPSPTLERCSNNTCNPRGILCADPAIIEIARSVQVFADDTYGGNAVFSGTCAPGDSPERIYSFTFSGLTAIEATVSGFDTVLYVRRDCTDDDPDNEFACNDESDPPGDNGSHLRAELPAGTYYLIVDGYDGDSGSYELSVSFELLCSDMDDDLECDESDGCPKDPEKVVGGACGCGNPDTDTDGDGTADCVDGCPTDETKAEPGVCGCGTPEGECSEGCGCEVGRARRSSELGGLVLVLLMLGGFVFSRTRRWRRHGGR